MGHARWDLLRPSCGVLRGSWDLVSTGISTLIGVEVEVIVRIVTLFITLVTESDAPK